MKSDNSSNSYRRGLSMRNFVGIPQGQSKIKPKKHTTAKQCRKKY